LPTEIEWRPVGKSTYRKGAAAISRLAELPRILREDGVEVFHAPGVHSRPSLPPIPSTPCPLVVTVHDVIPVTFYGGHHSQVPTRVRTFYRWNLRRGLRADRVVTVSRHSRAEIVAMNEDVDRRIVVLAPGTDFSRNEDVSVLERMDVQFPYVLYAGSYEPRKNLKTALAAFSRLVAEGFPHHLVAVVDEGSGYASTLDRYRQSNDVMARVRLVQSLPDADLRALYTFADVLLFPSLAEGFGLPPVQALACNLPVVVSDLEVHREVLTDAAEFVDPTDIDSVVGGLRRVLLDPSRRSMLRRAGRKRWRMFEPQTWAAAHALLYAELSSVRR
jgi:glycosyltransferase involved in cell wall biosynthesis